MGREEFVAGIGEKRRGPYVGRGLFVGGIGLVLLAFVLWVSTGAIGEFAVGPIGSNGAVAGLAGVGLAAVFVAMLVGSNGRSGNEGGLVATVSRSGERGSDRFGRATNPADRTESTVEDAGMKDGEPTTTDRSADSSRPTIDRSTITGTSGTGPRRTDGGVDAIRFDSSVDRYCGNCTHFRYVRTEAGMSPYCGYHEELMDDMESCLAWQSNA